MGSIAAASDIGGVAPVATAALDMDNRRLSMNAKPKEQRTVLGTLSARQTQPGGAMTVLATTVVLLTVAACGTPTEEELTAISGLGPSPTPVANAVTMFGGNSSGDGVFDASGPAFAAEETWRIPLSGDIVSPPLVSGGTIFVGAAGDTPGEHYLYALDSRTQKERWRFATARSVYSAPAVSDGIVFLTSADRHIYALDASTGQEKWRFEALGGVWASPVVSDETVFFTSLGGHVYALDTATGQERWSLEIFSPTQVDTNTLEFGTWLSPSVRDGTVYAGSLDWHLYAIDAESGQEKWRFKTKGAVWGSPAISRGTAYVGSDDLHLYAVDISTGAEKWKFKSQWPLKASPVVFGDTVVFHRGRVHGLDADTGEEKWQTDVIAQQQWAQPIVSRGRNLIYLTGRRDVYALDVESGNTWWETDVDGWLSGYLGVEDGALYVVAFNDSGPHLVALE